MRPGHQIVVGASESVTIRELVTSYCRALHRFDAEQLQSRRGIAGQHELAYASLFESLAWADAIDEFLTHGATEKGGAPDWRDDLEPRQVLVSTGIQHARNVVHHQWWEALATEISVTDGGEHINTWIWGELPSNNRDKQGKKAYKAAIEGLPVLGTLICLRDIYWRFRRWQITARDLAQRGFVTPDHAPLDK